MTKENLEFNHESVLSFELLKSLNLKKGDLAIDCTTGGGGHAAKMVEQIAPSGKLLALDQDQEAIQHLKEKFSAEIESQTVILEHTPFSQLKDFVAKHNFHEKTSAVIADIGVSSHQINTAIRGFSFQKDGPLDMRMDQYKNPLTAKEVVNSYPEAELAQILFDYGQESHARRIVKRIVQERSKKSIETTSELSEIIRKSLPYQHSKKNPATKTFQALRIYVNQELEQLKQMLEQAFSCLKVGGRLAIITFHSLEDKIVKDYFLTLAGKKNKNLPPREIPLTQKQINDYNNVSGKVIKPFPTNPSDAEINVNPRARSARLRVIEKIE